ncbi:hypothetical protein [Nitrosospira briensis]|nr:hypothetical protein [Nitrosospira briensis]
MGGMIYLDMHHLSMLDWGLERELIASITPRLVPLFDSGVPRHRTCLIVASSNAGAATSVKFWADAAQVGPALASPELFPWCLANAPCGAIARHFGVTGPNFTLLGAGDAMMGAIEAAAGQFALDCADMAVVVVPQFAELQGETGHLFAFRLQRHDVSDPPSPVLITVMPASVSPAPAPPPLPESVETFVRLLRQLDDGGATAGLISDGQRSFRLERPKGRGIG